KRQYDDSTCAGWRLKLLEVAPPPSLAPHGAALVLTEPVVYQVKMTTNFAVPAGNQGIDQVRVWHALPTHRPWSHTAGQVGATDMKWTGSGAQQYEKAHDSHHILWDKLGKPPPGAGFYFTSQFTVHSVQREFLPENVKVQWQDYNQPPKDPAAK